MSEQVIALYDIASKLSPNPGLSPFTLRVRYALNFMGLPYETVWVEYPEIEGECKKIGAAPTGKKSNGEPLYTLPVIKDPTTGAVVSDSVAIVEYLEKTYPSAPTLFPKGITALQLAFLDALSSRTSGMLPFMLALAPKRLNPPSEEYWRVTRTAMFGKKPEDLVPKGEERVAALKKLQASFGEVDAWISKNSGKFIAGDEMTFVDLAVGAVFASAKNALGEEEADLWEEIAGWHNGRWEQLRKACEKYHK